MSIRNVWKQRIHRRRALAHLDTLTQDENKILFGCASRNERTFIASITDPTMLAAAIALHSKGLLEPCLETGFISGVALPYTIPTFVWDELQLRRDHSPIKWLCRATLGFKSMKTAYATIKGFEGMRMIRKRQCILLKPGITGEVRFVAKLFGVCA